MSSHPESPLRLMIRRGSCGVYGDLSSGEGSHATLIDLVG